jgi:hypothetical protein
VSFSKTAGQAGCSLTLEGSAVRIDATDNQEPQMKSTFSGAFPESEHAQSCGKVEISAKDARLLLLLQRWCNMEGRT